MPIFCFELKQKGLLHRRARHSAIGARTYNVKTYVREAAYSPDLLLELRSGKFLHGQCGLG